MNLGVLSEWLVTGRDSLRGRSMKIDGNQLYARQRLDAPPVHFMMFDDGTRPVKIGAVWGPQPHLWRRGLDGQMTDHKGRRINDTTSGYEAALQAFRAAFLKWLDDHAVEWPSIQDSLRE